MAGWKLEKLPLSLQQRSWLGCYWGWRSRKLMLRWRKCSGDGGEKENGLFTKFHTQNEICGAEKECVSRASQRAAAGGNVKITNESGAGRQQENFQNVTWFWVGFFLGAMSKLVCKSVRIKGTVVSDVSEAEKVNYKLTFWSKKALQPDAKCFFFFLFNAC